MVEPVCLDKSGHETVVRRSPDHKEQKRHSGNAVRLVEDASHGEHRQGC